MTWLGVLGVQCFYRQKLEKNLKNKISNKILPDNNNSRIFQYFSQLFLNKIKRFLPIKNSLV